MIIGLEIELEVDNQYFGFDYGAYHEGNEHSENWSIETDSSIYENYDIDYSTGLEFVSNPFVWNSAEDILHEFRYDVMNNESFYDYFSLNQSCGNHIHISKSQP